MSTPTFKDLTKSRALKVGTAFLEFDSPGVGQIAKAGGAEFAFVDMEHSGFGIDTVKRILRYMQAAELPTLVRPPSKAYNHVARVLDIGAEGLLLPMVGSADEAEIILNYMKYVPEGGRGVALSIAHDRYRPGVPAEKLAAANAMTACVPLIETRDGIAKVEEICALPGVDGVWIGHFDLSCSLGIPGQFAHRDFRAATRKVVAAAKKHRKLCGRMVSSPAEGVKLYAEGFDMVCYSADVFLLQAAIESGIAAIRQGVARKKSKG
jgi:2-dehydro-3-deoxyglucarate aldolase/4-hydroxy-2-oxoheptanedioate aldolase